MEFKCPKCQDEKLEEVSRGTYSCIVFVNTLYDEFDYGDIEAHDSYVERYQCSYCGFVLKDENGQPVTTYEQVIDWLKRNTGRTQTRKRSYES